jgi:hypothetical protein
LQAQNPGEIIFSKKLIDPNNPSDLTTQFQAGEHIYAVAFFPKDISGMRGRENPKKVDIEIFLYELKPPLYDYQQPSEAQMEFGTLHVSGSSLQNKYLIMDIVPNKDEITSYGNNDLVYNKFGKDYDGPVKYSKAIGKLTPGEHTIIVKVNINYQFVAEGKFVIKGDDFSFYSTFAKELNESVDNLKMKDAVMPKAAMKNKKLENEMIAAFKKSQIYKDRIKGEVIHLVIIDPDWMIRRNQLTGVILHRYIRAAVAVKNADGTCTVWQLVTFQQDYVGNKFQKTKFDGVGDPYKIPCENVKK